MAEPVVVVANRLPLRPADGNWELAPGGLVAALVGALSSRQGVWVGADLGSGSVPGRLADVGVSIRPVQLSGSQVRGYLHGFANRTLWPLHHNAIERPVLDSSWWENYREVNRSFATAAAAALSNEDGLLWVHDYHLMLTPRLVRERLAGQRIGFFLHVPWPEAEIFARLPWRGELVRGLLGADVVSFQTERHRDNFVRSCARILGSEIAVSGEWIALRDGRVVRTMASPISIDTDALSARGDASGVDAIISDIRRQFAGRALMLGVDRLDYTKGIIERLQAFEELLARRPDLRGRLSLVQIASPTRDDVDEYRELRSRIELITGRINGRFTEPGQDVPVHYLHRNLTRQQLVAYYACADIMLVTPLADGMNLVAKEYATVQDTHQGAGTLVLSEFAGAAEELREASRCNPYDVADIGRHIERALVQPTSQRRAAITAMGRRVRSWNVHHWTDAQLAAITGAPYQGR